MRIKARKLYEVTDFIGNREIFWVIKTHYSMYTNSAVNFKRADSEH